MKASKQTQEVQILRQAMLFGLTRRAWSNRRMANREHIKTEEADSNGVKSDRRLSSRVNATKSLIVCAEYDNIMAHLNGTYTWVLSRSMLATGIGRGINFVRRDSVDEIIQHVESDRVVLLNELVPALIEVYPQAKANAKRPMNDEEPEQGGLGSLYVEADYPAEPQLAGSFDIEYRVFALSVPDELPEEIRVKENAKLRESFERAQVEVLFALREGFQGLVEHAIDRLKVNPGEKPKIFVADAMVERFVEFFDTFRHKNLMDDQALEDVVGRAQGIVLNFAPNMQTVKHSTPLRNQIAGQLAEVKSTLDGLLKDRPTRRFDFTV